MTDRETRRWYGVSAVAFLSMAVGVLARRPALLLVAVVGVAFAAYARAGSPPEVSLAVERTLSDREPDPGDEVEVTVRITNEGGTLPDLRLVDGVPDGLGVVDGSPRRGTALRPGKSARFSYTVAAERGEHAFGPVTAIARDASGAVERETAVEAEAALTCLPRMRPLSAPPLRAQTTPYTGTVASESGGSGTEFYATREYRPGDAMNRIDWSRLARTRELSTLEFREERAADVVLLIDARPNAYVGGERSAVDRSVEAAARAFASLLDAGHRVGVSAFGVEPCWLAPDTGSAHRAAARRLLGTHPALPPTRPDGEVIVSRRVRELRYRLSSGAQVILFSPLPDDYVTTTAARLDAGGLAVTVVSPDVTGDGTPGRRLARLERRDRLSRLRAARIPAIDWPAGEGIERAIEAARRRGR